VKQLAFDLVAPPAPTLENFIAGELNLELLQRLRQLARAPAAERIVYVWGAPASGRSHLLRGALVQLERDGLHVAYYEAPGSVMTDFEEIGAAAVDDIHKFDDAGQSALFNLYNRQRENGGVFLATGNAPPSALRLRTDLATRLAWGLVYEVHALSDAEKLRALTQHAAARGFELPPEVAQYLLSHVRRDMRTLTAMIDALDRYGLQAKRPITLPLLRQMLNHEQNASNAGTAAPTGLEARS
jgi:DnaA family protein